MFSLVKYVKKELKKSQLNEAFDYFNALSDEVKRHILSYRTKNKVGKASEVEIKLYDPGYIYDLLKNNNIAIAVLRYGQDDMLLFKNEDYQGIDPEKLEDLKEMDIYDDDYSKRFQLPNYIKSESGFVKVCNNLCLFISKMTGIKKKDVVLKMNFQVVYFDQSKNDIKMQRSISRSKYNPTITKNGVTTPSNQMYDDPNSRYDKHEKLKQRLKAYIESKIPNILDINNLPKDVSQLSNQEFQFKLMGDTYKYYTSERIDGVNILNGIPFGLDFQCTNQYNEPKNELLPRHIVFNVAYKNGKFEVIEILCTDRYSYYGRNDSNTMTLSDFMAKREQEIANGKNED